MLHGGGRTRGYKETPREKYQRDRKTGNDCRAALDRAHKTAAQVQRVEEALAELNGLLHAGGSRVPAVYWHAIAQCKELRACLFEFEDIAERLAMEHPLVVDPSIFEGLDGKKGDE